MTNFLTWITDQYPAMLALLEKWVLINSGSDNLSGLKSMLHTLTADFSILKGDETKHIELPPRRIISEKGEIIFKESGQALSIRKHSKAPLQILFSGHMDTVFSPHHHFQGIRKEKNNIWKGPGVTDMKGGLIVLLKTLEAVEEFALCPNLGWEILITPDEEVGSSASYSLFIEAAKRNHFGLIFEPAFSDGAFVSHRKGSANLTLVVKGQAAHAGRDFHQGKSAIYALAYLLNQIESLNNVDKGITINAGHIQGGGAVNIVPDFAVCRLNIRARTSEDMLKTQNTIQSLVNHTKEGIEYHLFEDYCRLPKPLNADMELLLKKVEECSKELNIPFHTCESGGVCDGNILANAGLPTMDSLGVVGGKLHTDEEYIMHDSLIERTKLCVLLLMKLCHCD